MTKVAISRSYFDTSTHFLMLRFHIIATGVLQNRYPSCSVRQQTQKTLPFVQS